MSCPKCGFPRQPGSFECPKCGIIYDKYQKYSKSEPTQNVRKVEGENKKEKIEIAKGLFKNLSIKKRISQLTTLQKTAFIVLAVLIIIGTAFMIYTPDITINGEIFAVTKQGQRINLGRVEVNAFSIDTLLPYLVERREEGDDQLSIIWKKSKAAKNEYDKAFQEVEYAFRWDFDKTDEALKAREAAERKWQKLRAEEEEIASCGFFFRNLPAPLTSTKTNSDGKFNIRIPGSGLHIITASATRQVSDDAEAYYWLKEIDPKDGSEQAVILSNDNVASTDDIENFINKYAHEL